MGSLRVMVFNMDEDFGAPLRNALMTFESLRIVADVDEPAVLPQAVEQFPAEVLVLHLDPAPQVVLPIAAEVASAHPNLAILAVSESTDGQLILSAMRLGFREFLTKPIDQGILHEALSKIAQRSGAGDHSGRLISIVGTAGGVGSTSLAVNLAVELADLLGGGVGADRSSGPNRRVVVVDLDYRFGQVATLLDVSPTYTIADLAQSPERLERQVVERTLVNHPTGVSVLSRPTHFVQSENITAASCVGVLSSLMSMHDYVVVDGPNRYDVGAVAVMDLADSVLLVLQLLVPSVRNAQRILQGMEDAGFNLGRTKLLINRAGRSHGPFELSDVEATLGRKVFGEIPDDWATMSGAINLGEPLLMHGPKTRIRMAIRELAERIHTPDGSADDKEAGKKGKSAFSGLSKLFSEP